ncbi:HigA family addiction module antitoxin [Phyllobacterium sp. NPDC097923]|uniref:HigA family addiction module antitoxin n=1 Tax=Phyllobacterium sp. NPDC097923 TaxID=3364404 RepID=UPI00383B2087
MMKSPAHPGIVLRETVLNPLGINVSEAAERLGMSRPALSRVLNGHAAISPELALRLEAAGVSEAKFWLNMQINFDLARARASARPAVKTIQPPKAA